MYSININIGPCNVHIDTDERLSFDALESLLNRGTFTVLTLMNAHMGAMVKYENMYNTTEDDPMGAYEDDEELDNVRMLRPKPNPEEV